MKKYININLLYILVIFLLLAISLLMVKPIGDEKEFHLPTLLNVCKEPLETIFSSNYLAANTPLPYYLNYLLSFLTPVNLYTARVITFLVSISTVFLIFNLLVKYSGLKKEIIYKILLIFLFFPNFVICTYSFYIPNYGLFFVLLFISTFEYKSGNIKQFLFGFILVLSVLSQQFYLAVYSSLGIFFLLKHKDFPKNIIKLFLNIIYLIIPFWIFYNWGGITNDRFRFYGVSLTLENVVSVFLIIGVYLFPYFFSEIKKLNKYIIIVSLIISILFVIFYFPDYSIDLYKGSFSGLVFKSINMTSRVYYLLPRIISVFLVAIGIIVVSNFTFKKKNDVDIILYISSLFLIIIYLFSEVLFEKHLLPLVFFLMILYLPTVKTKILNMCSYMMVILGLVYYFYWFFLKDFNG